MTEDICSSSLKKALEENNGSRSINEIKHGFHVIKELELYFRKGDLAEKRDKRIAEWMEKDMELDSFYEKTNVNTPYCIYCNNKMEIFLKDLDIGYGKEKSRILFIFTCNPCKYKRGMWDNGEEYKIEKNVCEVCKSEDVKTSLERGEEYDIFRTTCNSCSHIKEEKWEHYKSHSKESDPNYEKDRERFCIGVEGLYEFRQWCKNMETMKERFSIETGKEEVANETPEKKSFDTPDIKEMISKGLRKFKYNDISFGVPVIKKKHVFIELTLSGKKLDEKEFIKQIEGILGNTNWRLDEKSVQIQLGVLQCRIEGE
ncbi:MAG: hypothetical protein PHH16_00700 [Candidatus Gracilibacteria bacterium]|nr:hypothetical protein [Candidatus Gracilibacteria bacterium]